MFFDKHQTTPYEKAVEFLQASHKEVMDTVDVFSDELTDYKVLKGTIQFQHTQELPKELIKKMILHKYQEVIK